MLAAFARRLHYADRPIEAALEAVRTARRTSAELLERLMEALGARGHAHRERARRQAPHEPRAPSSYYEEVVAVVVV